MSKTSRRKRRRQFRHDKIKRATKQEKAERLIVTQFLSSLSEGMDDGERADLHRDLLMGYYFFNGRSDLDLQTALREMQTGGHIVPLTSEYFKAWSQSKPR